MRPYLVAGVCVLFTATAAQATTWYIRTDGGTGSQCTGIVDAAYPGSGSNQPCALNHPNWVIPPRNENTSRAAKAGDTVVIKPGSYRIGCQNEVSCRDVTVNLGINGSAFCDDSFPYDCYMGTVPDGVTVIGCSATGCADDSQRPELWGAGGVRHIIDAQGTTNVRLQDLELTDRAALGAGHPTLGGYPATSTMLRGENGIVASDSRGLTITDMYIHGFWHKGVIAGRAANISFDGSTRIDFNAFAGVEFDICQNNTCGLMAGDSVVFEGTNIKEMVSVSWNGCIEDPNNLGSPVDGGCYNDDTSGYGDGLGTPLTSGTWVMQYVTFEHNTSDGLDLKYCTEPGCTISISNSYFGGNAGNQVKTSGTVLLRNSLVEGDCDYFAGKPFTISPFAHCRAGGDAVGVDFAKGNTYRFFGNTLVNVRGNGAFVTGARGQDACSADNTLEIRNSVLASLLEEGTVAFMSTGSNCQDAIVTVSHTNAFGFSSCPSGIGNVCSDPLLSQPILNSRANFYLSESSPSRDIADETVAAQGTTDFNDYDRGLSWDAGALEFGSPKVGVAPHKDGREGSAFVLEANVPNPFVTRTRLYFAIGHPGRVQLEIVDLAGRRVRTIIDEVRMAGRQSVMWDGDNDAGALVPAGIYWLRGELDGKGGARRILILR